MNTHNVCFYEELVKIILQLSPNTHLICSTETCFSLHISEGSYSHKQPDTQLSSSASSIGFYSNQSEHSDPSPPSSHLSESAPAGSAGMLFGPFMPDEGLGLEEEEEQQNIHNKVTIVT